MTDPPAPDEHEEPRRPSGDADAAPTGTVERSRTASTFVGVIFGLAVALLMLLFVLQNGDPQAFEFLWVEFTLPGGVAILLAFVLGGLVAASFGIARVIQLRVGARRHREAEHAPRPAAR